VAVVELDNFVLVKDVVVFFAAVGESLVGNIVTKLVLHISTPAAFRCL
jgi:hypothetical protein